MMTQNTIQYNTFAFSISGKTYFDLNSYMEFDTKLKLSFDLNLNTEHLHFDLEKRHKMDIDTEKN